MTLQAFCGFCLQQGGLTWLCADNWLTGPLTPMMALPNLQYLDIAGNLLSGSVATTLLSALPQLVMLKLVRPHLCSCV